MDFAFMTNDDDAITGSRPRSSGSEIAAVMYRGFYVRWFCDDSPPGETRECNIYAPPYENNNKMRPRVAKGFMRPFYDQPLLDSF